jgi:hypothetical protein
MAKTTKITSPVEGLNTSTAIGPLVLNFKDSVAEVRSKDLTDGARAYLEANGYGIDGSTPKGRDVRLGQAEPADPRKASQVRVGTPIRDGAVDPRDKDFLGPINAGKSGKKGNPHSTNVRNPEIHASEGLRPIKAGPVHVDDPGAQDAAEKAHAEAATDGTPVLLTEEEQELLGVDAYGRPTEPDSEQIVGDPDAVDPDDLTGQQGDGGTQGQGDPDSESTGDPSDPPADGEAPAAELKGQALTDALKAAGLPLTGSADEKRAALAQHRGEA